MLYSCQTTRVLLSPGRQFVIRFSSRVGLLVTESVARKVIALLYQLQTYHCPIGFLIQCLGTILLKSPEILTFPAPEYNGYFE